MQYRAIILNDSDNVATAVSALAAGETVELTRSGESITVILAETIAFGHKFAVEPIGPGDAVLKYGEVIGKASRSIAAGAHVHVHNVESTRGRGDLTSQA